jgi:hypothetical protein
VYERAQTVAQPAQSLPRHSHATTKLCASATTASPPHVKPLFLFTEATKHASLASIAARLACQARKLKKFSLRGPVLPNFRN